MGKITTKPTGGNKWVALVLVNETEAAEILGLPVAELVRLRASGAGPTSRVINGERAFVLWDVATWLRNHGRHHAGTFEPHPWHWLAAPGNGRERQQPRSAA